MIIIVEDSQIDAAFVKQVIKEDTRKPTKIFHSLGDTLQFIRETGEEIELVILDNFSDDPTSLLLFYQTICSIRVPIIVYSGEENMPFSYVKKPNTELLVSRIKEILDDNSC